MTFDYRMLDPLLDSRMRVAILALLLNGDTVDFVHMRDKLQVTDGNLAKHLRRLEESEYVRMEKSFLGRRPRTSYTITDKGREGLQNHVKALSELLK